MVLDLTFDAEYKFALIISWKLLHACQNRYIKLHYFTGLKDTQICRI